MMFYRKVKMLVSTKLLISFYDYDIFGRCVELFLQKEVQFQSEKDKKKSCFIIALRKLETGLNQM